MRTTGALICAFTMIAVSGCGSGDDEPAKTTAKSETLPAAQLTELTTAHSAMLEAQEEFQNGLSDCSGSDCVEDLYTPFAGAVRDSQTAIAAAKSQAAGTCASKLAAADARAGQLERSGLKVRDAFASEDFASADPETFADAIYDYRNAMNSALAGCGGKIIDDEGVAGSDVEVDEDFTSNSSVLPRNVQAASTYCQAKRDGTATAEQREAGQRLVTNARLIARDEPDVIVQGQSLADYLRSAAVPVLREGGCDPAGADQIEKIADGL